MIDTSIISIDPSSTATGVALFSRAENLGSQHRLVRWTTIRPKGTKTPTERCLLMAATVAERVREYAAGETRSPVVVIEIPGAQGRGSTGMGLLTLGVALGMILKALHDSGLRVEMIPANRWTRLDQTYCMPKDARAERIRQRFPEYTKDANDKGLDAADAIGLGAWYLGHFPRPAKGAKPLKASASPAADPASRRSKRTTRG